MFVLFDKTFAYFEFPCRSGVSASFVDNICNGWKTKSLFFICKYIYEYQWTIL